MYYQINVRWDRSKQLQSINFVVVVGYLFSVPSTFPASLINFSSVFIPLTTYTNCMCTRSYVIGMCRVIAICRSVSYHSFAPLRF